MTTRPVARPSTLSLGEFREPPPREDLQNTNFLNYPAWLPVPFSHFRFSATAIVTSDTDMGEGGGTRVPDLLIVFDIGRNIDVRDKIYTISGQGKPPDFVLEIASKTTADNVEEAKRAGYV
jgi:Uma2 family endonuclease